MTELKEFCSAVLGSKISSTNWIDLLLLSELYGGKSLTLAELKTSEKIRKAFSTSLGNPVFRHHAPYLYKPVV
jgi:hypothetical protein